MYGPFEGEIDKQSTITLQNAQNRTHKRQPVKPY